MATKLYVWWGSSGNPPFPWQKVTDYDGKYVRFDSNPSSALTTGGNPTHTHSLGTGHIISNVLDNKASSGSLKPRHAWATAGHNHAIGNVAIVSADNAPTYYTVSLIAMDLGIFFSSERRLPKNSIVASTSDISKVGLTKIANNKLIKLGPSPASTGGSESHIHSFSGSLSIYDDIYTYAAGGGYVALYTADHSHGLTGLNLASQSSMPARIQTRLFKVTTDYTDKIPAKAVMFVDGPITGYTDQLEILSDWNGKMIESADQDEIVAGSDVHNHGSSVSGNTATAGGSSISCSTSLSDTTVIPYGHVHAVTINLNTTDVNLLPPYVNFVPVKVKLDILPKFTKQTTLTMATLMKRIGSKSYGMSMKLNPVNVFTRSKTYEVDSLLKKTSYFLYHMDVLSLLRGQTSYTMDVKISPKQWKMDYSMSLKIGPRKGVQYTMGLRVVSLDVIPKSRVIDVLQDSWIMQYNKLLQTIEASKYGITLDGASSYSLEKKFGRAFNLPRDPGESDTSYRERIRSYTSSVMGCGTKPTLLSLLNSITLGEAARIDVYPGLIRIYFDDGRQCDKAREREATIEKVLASSVAAGVQWHMFFTHTRYNMDFLLHKLNIPKNYNIDTLVLKTLSSIYTIDIKLVFQKISPYNMDAFLLKTCQQAYKFDTFLQKRGSTKDFNLDAIIKSIKQKDYYMDTLIERSCLKPFYLDMMLQKSSSKLYSLDALIQNTEYKFYNIAIILMKPGSSSYGMSMVIV